MVRVVDDGEYEPIPYKSIFTDICVIGILLASFGGNFGFQTFFQYGPVYLNKVRVAVQVFLLKQVLVLGRANANGHWPWNYGSAEG